MITIGALAGAGTVTNSGGGTSAEATLNIGLLGTSTGSGVFSGLLQNGAGILNVTKNGTGTESFSGVNTYTGVTTINGGTLAVTSLANIGTNSAIGAGIATSNTTNAASLVFSGGTLQYTGANASIYQTTETPSISINRLFTLAGNGTLDSTGTYGNQLVGTATANNAALIFNNTAPVAFAGSTGSHATLAGELRRGTTRSISS